MLLELPGIWKTYCFPSTVWFDNELHTHASCQLSELTTIDFRAPLKFQLLLFLAVSYTKPVENTRNKTCHLASCHLSVIISFLLNVFSCRFLKVIDSVYELKAIRKTVIRFVILKNSKYLNELRGAVSLQSQTNTNT